MKPSLSVNSHFSFLRGDETALFWCSDQRQTFKKRVLFKKKKNCHLPYVMFVNAVACVCLCVCVLSLWAGRRCSHWCDHAVALAGTFTFALSVVQKNKQSAVWDIRLDRNDQQKIGFSVIILPNLSCLPGNKDYIVSRVFAMFVLMLE